MYDRTGTLLIKTKPANQLNLAAMKGWLTQLKAKLEINVENKKMQLDRATLAEGH